MNAFLKRALTLLYNSPNQASVPVSDIHFFVLTFSGSLFRFIFPAHFFLITFSGSLFRLTGISSDCKCPPGGVYSSSKSPSCQRSWINDQLVMFIDFRKDNREFSCRLSHSEAGTDRRRRISRLPNRDPDCPHHTYCVPGSDDQPPRQPAREQINSRQAMSTPIPGLLFLFFLNVFFFII